MPVNADSTLEQEPAAKPSASSSERMPGTYDLVITWAPLVISLLGALIVADVFFNDWAVLIPSM